MSVTAWILLGVAVWVALALVVALLVGRMVRQRDRQVPVPESDVAVPSPRDGHDRPAPSVDGPPARRSGGAPPA